MAGTCELTGAGDDFLEQFKVDGALIIAAGFGSRFVPLTFETPKGLLEVFGERMIERQIRQLHEVGITDITIAVGYLKEKFEYLIDKYQVKLLYNPEYASKNTLTTIYRARKVLAGKNMYILSSDNWLRDNMFPRLRVRCLVCFFLYGGDTSEWCLSFNKRDASPMWKWEARFLGHVRAGVLFRIVLRTVSASSGAVLPHPGTEQFYWENVLIEHLDTLEMDINRQPEHQIYEFENLEELRQFDPATRIILIIPRWSWFLRFLKCRSRKSTISAV